MRNSLLQFVFLGFNLELILSLAFKFNLFVNYMQNTA